MLSDMFDAYGERLVYAVLGLGIAFLALIVVLWLIRRRGGPAPFLKGGKNRQPRLQVLDATAVDARRRLVLVRRDNVEHLIMIGGPTDIVVESGIGAIPIMTDVSEPTPLSIEAPQEPKIAEVRAAKVEASPAITTEASAIKTDVNKVSEVSVSAPLVDEARGPAPDLPKIADTHQPVAPSVATKAPTVEPKLDAAPPVKTPSMAATASPTPLPTASKAPTSPVVTASMGPRSTAQSVSIPTAASTVTGVASQRVEPVISDDVSDIFDKARERVLPDIAGAKNIATANPAHTPTEEQISEELRSDFESFLNAEIEKRVAPEFDGSLDAANSKPAVTGATVDADAQHQMARIFGELSVKPN